MRSTIKKKKDGITIGRLIVMIGGVIGVLAAIVAVLQYFGFDPFTHPHSPTPTKVASTKAPVPSHIKIGVVSNFDPGPAWTQIENGAPHVGLAIINPDSGPGSGPDPDFVNQVRHTSATGIMLLGYVDTALAGTKDTSRTLVAVEHDIADYYTWYPGIGGIFMDNVTTDCAHATSYYHPLYAFIKAKDRNAKVVLDPGAQTSECYMQSAGDIVVEFDDAYAQYSDWTSAGWESKYPADRFWHILSNTSQGEVPQAVALAQSRNVGWIYITDETQPDPFASLPTYWNAEVEIVGRT